MNIDQDDSQDTKKSAFKNKTSLYERECRVCGEVKPLDLDHFPYSGDLTAKWYFCWRCRDCTAAASRKWWRETPGAKERDKARRDQNRDQIRAYDRMRAKRDRAKKKIIIERWIANNPERAKDLTKLKSRRYRARKRNAAGDHTVEDIAKILAGQKGRCWWCGKKVGSHYHADHRFALARGGTNGPENLVISCPTCNFRKNAQEPHEFAGRLL